MKCLVNPVLNLIGYSGKIVQFLFYISLIIYRTLSYSQADTSILQLSRSIHRRKFKILKVQNKNLTCQYLSCIRPLRSAVTLLSTDSENPGSIHGSTVNFYL